MLNLGGDVSDSDVTGFRIDVETGEAEIIPIDRAELELLAVGRREMCSPARRDDHGIQF